MPAGGSSPDRPRLVDEPISRAFACAIRASSFRLTGLEVRIDGSPRTNSASEVELSLRIVTAPSEAISSLPQRRDRPG